MGKVVRFICSVIAAVLWFQAAQAATWQASSHQEEAALAGDGLATSVWASAAVSAYTPQWLMVDLGEKLEFSALKLQNSGQGEGGNYYSPRKSLLEGSNDPVAWLSPKEANWTKIADFNLPNASGSHTLSFAKVSFRFVRLSVQSSWVENGRVEIAELKLLPSLLASAQVKGIKISSHVAGHAVTLAVDAEVAKNFPEAVVVELRVKKDGEVLAEKTVSLLVSQNLISQNFSDLAGIDLFLPPPKYEVEVKLLRGTILAQAQTAKVVGIEEAKGIFTSPFNSAEFDRYGGFRGIKGQQTGFFHTERIGQRDWFITPEGNAFWSLSIDVLMMLEHWSIPHVDFCQDRYGDDYGFAKYNVPRVKALGFNSAGFWTTPAIRRQMQAYDFPYFINLGLMPRNEVYQLKDKDGKSLSARDLNAVVDPFNPQWRQLVLDATANLDSSDPYLIGYFIDNEIGIMWPTHHLYDFFYSPYTYSVFVEMLQGKYLTIERLNQAWSSEYHHYNYTSFTQIKQDPPQVRGEDDPVAIDLALMERRIIKELVEFPISAIRRVDHNHLIVGLRFAGTFYPEYMDLFASYDVNSINIYNSAYSSQLGYHYYTMPKQIAQLTGKPVIITEFSFKADDSGLPNDRGAGCKVETQEERAKGYAAVLTALAGQGYVIGAHYFSWQDSETSERSNYGIVNWQEKMYRPLAETMKQLNPHLYQLTTQVKDPTEALELLFTPEEGTTTWIRGKIPYFVNYTYQKQADDSSWLYVGKPYIGSLAADTDFQNLLARPKTVFSFTDQLTSSGRKSWQAPLSRFFSSYQLGTPSELGAESVLVDDFERDNAWQITTWLNTGETAGSAICVTDSEAFTGSGSLQIDYSLTSSGLDHFLIVKEGQWNLKEYNGLEFAFKGDGSNLRLAIFLMDSRGAAKARYYGYNAPFTAKDDQWVKLAINFATDLPLADGGADMEKISYIAIMFNDGNSKAPLLGTVYLDDIRLVKLPAFQVAGRQVVCDPLALLVTGTPKAGVVPVLTDNSGRFALLWHNRQTEQYFLSNPSFLARSFELSRSFFSFLQERLGGTQVPDDGFIRLGDLLIRYLPPASPGDSFHEEAWFYYDSSALKVSDASWSDYWQAEEEKGCFKLLRVVEQTRLEFTVVGLTEVTIYPREVIAGWDDANTKLYLVGSRGELLEHPFAVIGDGIKFTPAPEAYNYLLLSEPLPKTSCQLKDLALFPNPFSPNASGGRDELNIVYEITGQMWSSALVRVAVFNLEGKLIRELWYGQQGPGGQVARWDGKDSKGRSVPSGLYLCRVEIQGTKEVLQKPFVAVK